MNRILNLFLIVGVIMLLAVGSYAADRPQQKVSTETPDIGTVEPQGSLEAPQVFFPQAASKVPLAGTYTIGATGDYPTINSAVADLMLNGVSAPVVFEFIDAVLIDSQVTIGSVPGADETNTITFKPSLSVVGPVDLIFYSRYVATGDAACFIFHTASYITIDGENRLSIIADTTTYWPGTTQRNHNVLWVRNGSHHLTFKNFTGIGQRRAASTAYALFYQYNTGYTLPNYEIVYDNLTGYRGNGGFWIQGAAAPAPRDYNITVTNCKIGGGFSPDPSSYVNNMAGIPVSGAYVENYLVDKCIFDGVMAVATVRGAMFSDDVYELVFSNNIIRNIYQLSASTASVRGIQVHGTAVNAIVSKMLFYNNMIYNLYNDPGTSTWGFGFVGFGGQAMGQNLTFHHNTFKIDAGTAALAASAFAFDLNSLGTQFDTVYSFNNIYSATTTTPRSCYAAAMWSPGASGGMVINSDYNLYYSNTSLTFIIPDPYNPASAYVTDLLQDWADFTSLWSELPEGNDSHSKFGDPLFIPGDAHISEALGDVSPADQMGTADYTYTYDIDGQLRSDKTPVDVGADAFVTTPFNYDAQAKAILAPFAGGIPPGYPTAIIVKVYNNSINDYPIPIRFKVIDTDGITELLNVVETTPVVTSYTELDYTFIANWTPPAAGTYTLIATTELVGDEKPSNDTYSRPQDVLDILVVSTYPYFENFETPKTVTWSSGAIFGSDNWILGDPTKLGGAHSGTNAWFTGPADDNYPVNWEAAVYSPFFDFSGVQKPILSFWHKFSTEPDWDGTIVEYTPDLGVTWIRLGTFEDPNGRNWYNNNSGDLIWGPPAFSGTNYNWPDWDYAQLKVFDLAGLTTPIRFRIAFGSDAYENDIGYAFDDFGIAEASSIAGMKWYDANQDGVKDLGEVGLEGWTINLSGDVTDTKVTDEEGKYEFIVFDGNYVVSEDLKPGWVNTYPVGGSHSITLAPGESVTDIDFGNYWANASITGMKWNDLNADGVKDAGEPGLDGWTINLAGPISGSTVTAGGGLFAFENLVEGTYTVSEELQAGWKNTFPTGGSHTVEITADGQVVGDVDFGNFKYAEISGLVYNDINHNGVKDLTETGVDGITVNLTGPMPGSTVTTGGGLYNLLADFGANVLAAVPPAGKYITAPASGQYDIDVNTSGMVFTDMNFGLSTVLDFTKFRSFIPEDIVAVDAKGKVPKPAKRKPIGGYWEFTLTNNTGSDQTELHIQFKNDVAFDRGLTALPFTSVTGDSKKKFDFTGATIPDGGSVIVKGYSKKGKPQQIKKYYWGANPKEHFAVNITPGFEYLELPMPTYANLIQEVYTDGGFAVDGGLLVGTPHPEAPKDFGWVLMAKYTDVQKSLRDKTGIHTGGPKFFDVFENSKPLVKMQKTLPPNKHNNKLFAELVALKLAIAASATEHTALGFGELVFDDTTAALIPFNGMKIKDIYAQVSAAMTSKTGDANLYYQLVRKLNEAFAGPIDTISFGSATVLKGVKDLTEVSFLRIDEGGLIARITPTERKYADVPDIFELAQNYPNPFNPTTTIQFILPEDAIVTLKVYNVLGQEVATLANKELFTEGMNEVEFDAGKLASGIYFYQITAEGVGESVQKFTQVKKMVLMK